MYATGTILPMLPRPYHDLVGPHAMPAQELYELLLLELGRDRADPDLPRVAIGHCEHMELLKARCRQREPLSQIGR